MPATSNFPNGFSFGLTLRGISIFQTHPGRVWWLSNNTTGLLRGQRGGSDGNRGDFNSPFSTLAGAITAIAADSGAGRGDILMIKPGHTETISSSTALTMSVAGLAVIGLGRGTARPKFTLDTGASTTVNVTAANVSFVNCQFVANFLSIAACFLLTTAKGFTLQACTFAETSNVLNFLNIVKSTGAANTIDGIALTDNNWQGLGTTSVNSFLLSANDVDSAVLTSNVINLARTVNAGIIATITAGVLTNLDCRDNVAISKQVTETGGALINVGGTTSTGIVARNYLGDLTTTGDLMLTTSVGVVFVDNKKTGVVSLSGFTIPAVDA